MFRDVSPCQCWLAAVEPIHAGQVTATTTRWEAACLAA